MRDPIELTRPAMWAIAHPVRFRIWELLREGPSTASRLAGRIGESRGSASYHLRMLARAGLIAEDESLGTRRERWWRRPEATVVGVVSGDAEGRAIDQRWLAVFFSRDEEVRRRFMIGRPSDEWVEASLVVNWFVPLTPLEADDLGRKLFELVDELRHRTPPPEAEQTLVSMSVLPVLGDTPGGARAL